jgi:hypothetical protein
MKTLAAVVFGAVTFAMAAAAPAYAIHDRFLPAGDCAAEGSQAVGHPAVPALLGAGQPVPNPGNSAFGVNLNANDVVASCHNA